MFAALKMLAPYRTWLFVGVGTAIVIAIALFYGSCRANAVALEDAENQIKDLRNDLSAARIELSARNDRIRDMNARHLEELRDAKELLNQSLAMAQVIRSERDKIREQLEVTQFELLEAIRDDEEMADWVDWPVPSSAWGLLRDAAQGPAGQ
jgi:biopolymer transport protein ExbB/TolQ